MTIRIASSGVIGFPEAAEDVDRVDVVDGRFDDVGVVLTGEDRFRTDEWFP
jgi:hypothetical protein